MALAAPDFFVGSLDPKKGAALLFNFAGWIRRRCNEILAEPELDVFKIYDLAGNCLSFRQEADKWRSNGDLNSVRAALIQLTREWNAEKTDAEINSDYTALYGAAGTFLTFATNNLPGAGRPVPNASVTVNRTWPNTDLTARVTKTAGITNQVTALRNIFA